MNNKIIITLLTLALVAPVAKAQNTAAGAAIGAVAGAAIGANNHDPLVGALTGALVGGLVGNVVDQSTLPPPAPAMYAPVPYAPTIVYSNVNYVWGPTDHYSRPEYVYVQVWNGFEWETSYYNYFQFQTWYGHHYRRPYHEEEFRHHWHR
jgi:Glycine zipper